MPRITIPFEDVDTGIVADTFKTMAALEIADNQENKWRLVEIMVGPSANTPQDLNVDIQVKRINDVSAGGAGTSTAITAANLPLSEDDATPPVDLEGNVNYSAEPTTYETHPQWHGSFNARGALIHQWEANKGPVVKRDQLLGLLAAPQTTTAITLSGHMIFEQV
jgi:hypothetical protein